MSIHTLEHNGSAFEGMDEEEGSIASTLRADFRDRLHALTDAQLQQFVRFVMATHGYPFSTQEETIAAVTSLLQWSDQDLYDYAHDIDWALQDGLPFPLLLEAARNGSYRGAAPKAKVAS